MAKKAPTNDHTFSPIRSGLLHAVLFPTSGATDHTLTGPRRSSATRVDTATDRLPTQNEDPAHTVERMSKRLTREKRVLISRSEEVALSILVQRLSSNGAVSLTLSHVLRACIALVLQCETELVVRVRSSTQLTRPRNGDQDTLTAFERSLAREVAAAIRHATSI